MFYKIFLWIVFIMPHLKPCLAEDLLFEDTFLVKKIHPEQTHMKIVFENHKKDQFFILVAHFPFQLTDSSTFKVKGSLFKGTQEIKHILVQKTNTFQKPFQLNSIKANTEQKHTLLKLHNPNTDYLIF